MYSFRIKGVPYDRWRLISCKECEERARYLNSREKRKKIGRKEKKKKKKFCFALMQNRHFRQLETFLRLSLDGGQFRQEAGASKEMNELQ